MISATSTWRRKPCNPSNLDQRRSRPSVCLGVDELPAAAPVVRWPSERRVRDSREGRHHPGLDLQIIVLALPCHFFLMRFEIVYALSDFVALRRWQDRWRNGDGRRDRFRCVGKRLLGHPESNRQVWNRLASLNVVCKRHRALDQCVTSLLQTNQARPPPSDHCTKGAKRARLFCNTPPNSLASP